MYHGHAVDTHSGLRVGVRVSGVTLLGFWVLYVQGLDFAG